MLAFLSPLAGGGDLLMRTLPQLLVILITARVGGAMLRRFGQPQVAGEIAAGLVLGPSVFGHLAPEAFANLFGTVGADGALPLIGQFGLLFLTLLMGMEFDFSHLRTAAKTATAVALGGIALPFAMGVPLAWTLHERLQLTVDRDAMALFTATALSITSIPVMGRILMDFGWTRTRFGLVAITAAGLDDALGWILLAAVSTVARGGSAGGTIASMMGLTAAFLAFALLVVRPLIRRFVTLRIERSGTLDVVSFTTLLVVIFACAWITEWIGVFALFGSFVLGCMLWDQTALREALQRQLAPIVYALFLPVFFALTGLRTDTGMLDSAYLWLLCGLVLLVGCAGKFLGCGGAARLCGLSWRESACVGILMNTRGLMGLVAIEVGRTIGVIDGAAYTMLVLMALATTFLTTPVLRLLQPNRTN